MWIESGRLYPSGRIRHRDAEEPDPLSGGSPIYLSAFSFAADPHAASREGISCRYGVEVPAFQSRD